MSSAEPSTGKPPPGSPSTFSSGTKTSLKCTSATLSRFSVRIGNALIRIPSLARGSTRNAVTPLCFLARSSDAAGRGAPGSAARGGGAGAWWRAAGGGGAPAAGGPGGGGGALPGEPGRGPGGGAFAPRGDKNRHPAQGVPTRRRLRGPPAYA